VVAPDLGLRDHRKLSRIRVSGLGFWNQGPEDTIPGEIKVSKQTLMIWKCGSSGFRVPRSQEAVQN
jgi:hypothetical protein